MAKSRRPEPQSAQLNVEQMKAALPKLERRITDLESFDVKTIRERWDPVMEAIVKKVDGTLQEILGYGTVEYNEYSVYSLDTLPMIMGDGRDPLPRVHDGYRKGIEKAILKLKTLKELFEERIADVNPGLAPDHLYLAQRAEGSKRIFVVHGKDEGLKETVARYLAKIDLQPVVLHEQANQGRTIIEKFEAHRDVEYAVVLFTPDDVGYPAGEPAQAKSRPRQNVILELGFFMAALGRNRVCVLYKGNVEIPSDYAGVLYVEFDNSGAWRFTIAREMKSVGIDIDLNKAV
jgi:predicted nucleotide-binding protein